jgi:hypothetical protein
MKQTSIIYPAKGKLNYDDDLSIMPIEDSRYRLNVIETEDGNNYISTNQLGNLAISETSKPYRLVPFVITGSYDYTFTLLASDYSHFTNYRASVYTDVTGATGLHINITTTGTTFFNFVNSLFAAMAGLFQPLADVGIITRTFFDSNTRATIVVPITSSTLHSAEIGRRNLTGTSKVIGYREDPENKAGIFFIYNSLGYSSIKRYNKLTNDYTYILSEETVPGFTENGYIFADIIGDGVATQDGEGQLLCWVDGGKPKKLNITKAINYTLRTGAPTYTTLTESILLAGAIPPLYAPTTAYGTGTNNINYLRGKIFQFAYYYIYDDDEQSVLSPHSRILIPQDEEKLNGIFVENIKINATIVITGLVSNEKIVKVGICYRIADVGTGVKGDWVLDDIIDVSGTTFTYTFQNDKKPKILSQTEAIRAFDVIPQIATRQSVINDSILVYGDITEGYDPIDINMALSLVYEQDNGVEDGMDVFSSSTSGNTLTIGMDYSATIEAAYEISIKTSTDTHVITFESNYLNGVKVTDATIAAYFVAKIIALTDAQVLTASIVAPNQVRITFSSSPIAGSLYAWGLRYDIIEKKKTFKSGTRQFTGIVYYDGFDRHSYVNRDSDDFIYVPFITERGHSTLTYYVGIQYSIANIPPIWATHYQIVNFDNVSYWLQTKARTNWYATSIGVTQDIVRESGLIKINANRIIVNASDSLLNYNIPSYEFAVGDRLRFIGCSGEGGARVYLSFLTAYVDVEIIGQDETYIYARGIENYPQLIALLDANNGANQYINFEIYRINNIGSTSIIYNEISEVFEVGNPGLSTRYHKKGRSEMGVTAQDQSPSNPTGVPATGVLRGGAYLYNRYFGNDSTSANRNICSVVESMNISDYYNSQCNSNGRQVTVNEYTRQEQRNILRYGGQYKDDSGLNFLFRFPSANFKKLDDRFGRIYNIEQIGDTLKVRQRSKISSFYLNAELSLDASGNETLVYSSDIIGSARKAIEEYGTTSPLSCSKAYRNAYFVDIDNSEVIRDSPNGLYPIGSAYKMKTYFKDKINTLTGLASYEIISGVDRGNNMLYVTFIDKVDGTYSETIRFSESETAWKSFHSFTPEMYGNIGEDTFLSFLGGNLYLHDSSSVNRCTFYGVKYSFILDVHCNQEPLINKLWRSILVHSNEEMSASDNGDVVIQPNSKYTYGMRSKIVEWDNQEGIFTADFLNDLLTNGTSLMDYDTHDLYNGRTLLGKEIKVRLHSVSNNEVNVQFVTINWQF